MQGDGDVKRREDLRRRQTKPTTTLFVVNFDVENTVERDLERHFEQFGKLTRVQIKRNYAFIQYDDVEAATAAVDNCHLSRLSGEAPGFHALLLLPVFFFMQGSGLQRQSRLAREILCLLCCSCLAYH